MAQTNSEGLTARPPSQLQRWIPFIVGTVVFLFLAGIGFLFYINMFDYQYHGSMITPPMEAPQIALNDQNGGSFQLSSLKGAQGKVVVMFFGYTNCTDVCPLTLANFKQIKESLGSRANQVEFMMVTVDPARDTQDQMRQYLAKFDPSFVGLTGSQAQLEPVWQAYGVYQQTATGMQGMPSTGMSTAAPNPSYMVDHSSRVYVIDRKGYLRMTYPDITDSSGLQQDIQHLLGEK